MKPTPAQIRALIEQAISKETDFVSGCKTSDQRNNPQVIEQRLKAEGRIDALDSVLSALNSDTVYLRILAGK
jgi:hypothetical protein